MIKAKPRTAKPSKNDVQENSLIEHLVPLMEEVNKSYGPAILEELQSRLEKTIDQFNEEIDDIVKKSFEKYRTDQEKVRTILVPKGKESKPKNIKKEEKKEEVPQFISEYEKKKSKTRSKVKPKQKK
ncbi:MAG: hypothetical protein ISR90_06195 [Candidatus Marinimicrobia bacterium]|nr:hypothetical protein [Candidatus Neomarinimicrobiota bacterium]MBL7023622.1 hypothetical protein [Candidatus Neomarinimicrobiota bacterium]MBL7109809.1 hypothetical protein [Candidatus Neomarinimicrobiota bacterium]